MKTSKLDIESRLHTATELRRAGKYRDAYQVIAPKVFSLKKALTDADHAAQLFETAQLLSLMQAGDYAVKILGHLKIKKAEEFRIAAQIYLSSHDYKLALACYQKYFTLLKGKAERPEMKRARLHMARAFIGLEQIEEALKSLKKIQLRNEDQAFRGRVMLVEAECLALGGKFDQAKKVLMRALNLFSPDEQTPDMGNLHKWLGYVMGAVQTDDEEHVNEEAEAHFFKAILFLRKPNLPPEGWLDAYFLMEEVGYLGEDKQIQASIYPSLPREFHARPGFIEHVLVGAADARIKLYPARGEYEIKGHAFTVLPDELKLLALLRFAGEWAIPVDRLKPMIWPDEPSMFRELDLRMLQLFKRLEKKYGIRVEVENTSLEPTVKLSEKSLPEVWAEFSVATRPLRFFEIKREFNLGEFAQFYSLTKPAALKQLADLIASGRVKSRKVGKSLRYEVV